MRIQHFTSWCSVFLLISALLHAANKLDTSSHQDPEEYRRTLTQLRQHIQSTQEQIKTTRDARNTANKALRTSEQRISRIILRLRDLSTQEQQKQQHLQQLDAQRVTQQAALREERHILARQVRAAHAMGRQERIKLLLNQKDPGAVSRMMVYYNYLNRERINRLKRLRQQVAELTDTRHQIADQTTQLAQIRKQQETEKHAIEQAQQARHQIVRHLDVELAQQDVLLQRLRDDAEYLEKLLHELHQALTDVAATPSQGEKFANLKGQLDWPVNGPILQHFGAPKIGKLRWDGVIINANEGVEVRATYHGRVAFADWFRGFGLLLIIDHGDGYMSLYGHNQSLFKEVGDWVESGEFIAQVGSTGGQKQSGVYFAIRHNGRAVNPSRWCKQLSNGKVG
jgi:septal ring factor EnvC (AmiA/AmiB activator)